MLFVVREGCYLATFNKIIVRLDQMDTVTSTQVICWLFWPVMTALASTVPETGRLGILWATVYEKGPLATGQESSLQRSMVLERMGMLSNATETTMLPEVTSSERVPLRATLRSLPGSMSLGVIVYVRSLRRALDAEQTVTTGTPVLASDATTQKAAIMRNFMSG